MNPNTTCRSVPGPRSLSAGLALAGLLVAPSLRAGISYDESVSGDLSNSRLSPTSVTLSPGSNEIRGTTGRSTSTDRDYFTFTVPIDYQLTSVELLRGTGVGGNAGFIGVEIGSQITVDPGPPAPANASGLLGWHHYTSAEVGTDILDDLGASAFGATGFAPPLGYGTYSVWVQDTSAGSFAYGFDFNLQRTPLPEARNGVLLCGAVATLVAFRRRLFVRRPAGG